MCMDMLELCTNILDLGELEPRCDDQEPIGLCCVPYINVLKLCLSFQSV